jgi:hypothetical protein
VIVAGRLIAATYTMMVAPDSSAMTVVPVSPIVMPHPVIVTRVLVPPGVIVTDVVSALRVR